VPDEAPAAPAIVDVGDPEEWTEMSDDAVVRVPRQQGRTVPLRPVGRRPRVRKVTRVVRHVDPWSTFKVALIFSAILYGVLLTAGVLLWNVALNTGTVDNVERWFTQFGWEPSSSTAARSSTTPGSPGCSASSDSPGSPCCARRLFNLVSDIVGGVRMTVLEEEVVERTISAQPALRRASHPFGRPPRGLPEPVEEPAS
jgi:hypothetical protein